MQVFSVAAQAGAAGTDVGLGIVSAVQTAMQSLHEVSG
jgi:hypothetical protein